MLLQSEDPYLDAGTRAFKKILRPDESFTVVSTVLPGETDMRGHATRAGRSAIDALGLYLYPGQISGLFRQLSGMNIQRKYFGTDIFESQSEVRDAGPIMQGALYPNFQMPPWFAQEYRAMFNSDTQIAYAYNAYAFAAITAELFANLAKRPTADQILARYRTAKGSEGGVEFKYKETPAGDHYLSFPVVAKRITATGFVEEQ